MLRSREHRMWPESAPLALWHRAALKSAHLAAASWPGGSRPAGGLEAGEAARWKGLLLNPAPVGFKPF